MPATVPAELRALLDDYHRMYAGRDDRLTQHFSQDFSGYTGGGDFLVKDTAEWVAITRQDFAQVRQPIRLELLDSKIQSLAPTIAVATSFFKIHLPIQDHFLSRRVARLVLVFREEEAGWKICHSGISLPEPSVREGEVYPMQELVERNAALQQRVAEQTAQLAEGNEQLLRVNQALSLEVAERRKSEEALEQERRRLLQALEEVRTLRDAAVSTAARDAGLTARETEVLRLVRDGRTNREIGESLGISERTVQKHVERVLSKMGAKTRLAAARKTFD